MSWSSWSSSLLVAVIGLVDVVNPRLKIDQAIKYYLALVFFSSFNLASSCSSFVAVFFNAFKTSYHFPSASFPVPVSCS
jgi:hypothetical protein